MTLFRIHKDCSTAVSHNCPVAHALGTYSKDWTEAAAKEGQLSGYAKPIIKDLRVLSWKEDKDKPLKLIWESVVEGVGWIFKNKKKDQLATRASFEGDISNPDINIWNIIGEVLYNAFMQAIYPSLENSVNLNKVGDKDKEERKHSSKKFSAKAKRKNNAAHRLPWFAPHEPATAGVEDVTQPPS